MQWQRFFVKKSPSHNASMDLDRFWREEPVRRVHALHRGGKVLLASPTTAVGPPPAADLLTSRLAEGRQLGSVQGRVQLTGMGLDYRDPWMGLRGVGPRVAGIWKVWTGQGKVFGMAMITQMTRMITGKMGGMNVFFSMRLIYQIRPWKGFASYSWGLTWLLQLLVVMSGSRRRNTGGDLLARLQQLLASSPR